MASYTLPIERFIKLRCREALSRPLVRQWFQCVSHQTAPGLCRSIAMFDDDNRPHDVAVIHQDTVDGHAYVIPLVRDLLEREVEPIATRMAEVFDFNFDIETSDTRLLVQSKPPVSLSKTNYLQLCAALSKQHHEDWVRERTDAGWRYGLTFSSEHKIHPLLRPWTELPVRYQQPDLTGPQTLIQMLDRQGYAIVTKSDLQGLTATL